MTKVFEPIVLEDTIENLEGYLAALQQDLFDIQGEAKALNREMIHKEDKQSLTAEMEALFSEYKKSIDENKIGGIPIDSEYVVFIIDTSGSMYNYAWLLVLQKVSETLDVYPKLKGIQVMNDMGNYMFSQYANEWIPDTSARRWAILYRLRSWSVFQQLQPSRRHHEGHIHILSARSKISLFVFGDEFSGRSIQRVVDIIDRINREDEDVKRLVRIHAISLPVQFAKPPRYQDTGIKFAILMRTLCERNGGTFVGLNDFRL